MNALFLRFKEELQNTMPQLISEILSHRPEEKIYAIAFVTTDDFYGMYAAFQTEEQIEALPDKKYIEYMRWSPTEWAYSDQGLPSSYTEVLYKNLVSVVDADKQLDFTRASDEKWSFAVSLMHTIHEALLALPQSIFERYGYHKDEITFLSTMSDGDYMEAMLEESAKLFNSPAANERILKHLHSCT